MADALSLYANWLRMTPPSIKPMGLLTCLSIAAILGTSAATPAAEPTANVLIELAFADDPGTNREQESLRVRVLIDGRVLIPEGPERKIRTFDRLSIDDLKQLKQETIESGRLRDCRSDLLKSAIESACRLSGLNPRISGAADTIVRYRDGNQLHEIRCHALSVAAARFTDFPEVQRLHGVQLRLQNVAAVARAGGSEASQQLAEIANRKLQRSHPNTPRLTERDLSMFRELSTGSRYVQFYRRPTGQAEELLVSLFDAPGQPPHVSVLVNPTNASQ